LDKTEQRQVESQVPAESKRSMCRDWDQRKGRASEPVMEKGVKGFQVSRVFRVLRGVQ
jgi:hypothetical protein